MTIRVFWFTGEPNNTAALGHFLASYQHGIKAGHTAKIITIEPDPSQGLTLPFLHQVKSLQQRLKEIPSTTLDAALLADIESNQEDGTTLANETIKPSQLLQALQTDPTTTSTANTQYRSPCLAHAN